MLPEAGSFAAGFGRRLPAHAGGDLSRGAPSSGIYLPSVRGFTREIHVPGRISVSLPTTTRQAGARPVLAAIAVEITNNVAVEKVPVLSIGLAQNRCQLADPTIDGVYPALLW